MNPISDPVAQAHAQTSFDRAGLHDNVQLTDQPAVDNHIFEK